jgi:hypothetical protein
VGIAGECHATGNLGERDTLVIKKSNEFEGGIIFNPCGCGLMSNHLAYLRKVFRRDAQF